MWRPAVSNTSCRSYHVLPFHSLGLTECNHVSSPGQVSRQTKQLLNLMASRPLLNVGELNSALFKFVGELREVKVSSMRTFPITDSVVVVAFIVVTLVIFCPVKGYVKYVPKISHSSVFCEKLDFLWSNCDVAFWIFAAAEGRDSIMKKYFVTCREALESKLLLQVRHRTVWLLQFTGGL